MNAHFKTLKDVDRTLCLYQVERRPLNLEEMRDVDLLLAEVISVSNRLLVETQSQKHSPSEQILRLKLASLLSY